MRGQLDGFPNRPFVVGYYVEDEQKASEIMEDAAAALRKVEQFCRMPPAG